MQNETGIIPLKIYLLVRAVSWPLHLSEAPEKAILIVRKLLFSFEKRRKHDERKTVLRYLETLRQSRSIWHFPHLVCSDSGGVHARLLFSVMGEPSRQRDPAHHCIVQAENGNV